MADEKTAETKETPAETSEKGEVRGTLIETGMDGLSDWGNTNVLVEKTPITEAGDTKAAEDANKEEEKEAVAAEAEPEPAAEVETIEIEDPGEFKPADYSFDVTILDAEGKNPRSRKISTIEQWDELLESDPNFGNATALLKAQRLATKMETGVERDQANYTERKTAYDEAVANEEARTTATNQIANEITYLVERGELPKVAAQYINANWSDPSVASQPGVKEQIALLNYMQRENAARTRAGLAPMTSALDAWNAFQLDEAKKTTETRTTEAGRQRREAGARVAGVAPNPTTAAPRGIMVGRAGRLEDLNTGQWEH